MEIEKLLQEIKKEGEKEKKEIRKEYELILDKIREEGEAEIKSLTEKEEEVLEKEKDRLLSECKDKEEFNARMRLLDRKKNLFSLAIKKAKGGAFSLSDKEKKEIYLREIESIDIGEEDLIIKVPPKKQDYFSEILQKINGKIREEDTLVFEDGFIIEGPKFLLEVTLSGIVEQKIEDEKDYFANILFSS